MARAEELLLTITRRAYTTLPGTNRKVTNVGVPQAKNPRQMVQSHDQITGRTTAWPTLSIAGRTREGMICWETASQEADDLHEVGPTSSALCEQCNGFVLLAKVECRNIDTIIWYVSHFLPGSPHMLTTQGQSYRAEHSKTPPSLSQSKTAQYITVGSCMSLLLLGMHC